MHQFIVEKQSRFDSLHWTPRILTVDIFHHWLFISSKDDATCATHHKIQLTTVRPWPFFDYLEYTMNLEDNQAHLVVVLEGHILSATDEDAERIAALPLVKIGIVSVRRMDRNASGVTGVPEEGSSWLTAPTQGDAISANESVTSGSATGQPKEEKGGTLAAHSRCKWWMVKMSTEADLIRLMTMIEQMNTIGAEEGVEHVWIVQPPNT